MIWGPVALAFDVSLPGNLVCLILLLSGISIWYAEWFSLLVGFIDSWSLWDLCAVIIFQQCVFV